MNIAVKVEDAAAAAEAEVYATPLAELNPAKAARFQADAIWPMFERLRREDPVHFTPDSEFGPYWSITKWNDIMAVDTNHERFSSADGITLLNLQAMAEQSKVLGERRRGGAGFITMDEPDHGAQRKAVSPTVAPGNLALMAPLVRERAGADPRLPADRRGVRLGRQGVEGTDGHDPGHPVRLPVRGPAQADLLVGHGHQHARPRARARAGEQKGEAMFECFGAFTELWNQRVNAEPGNDLISMLAHSPATRNMEPREYLGNVVLLIVGGNDTTRNTISGSVYGAEPEPRPVRQAARQPRA